MSDIFISYASADRDKARALASVLGAKGWSVWWDRTIPPGKAYEEVIEEALDSAKCVVVLWSKSSIASEWVKTEAADALGRKALVPALIERVKIPLEFRRLHAADLSGWQHLAAQQDPETQQQLDALFQSIHARLAPSASTQPPPSKEHEDGQGAEALSSELSALDAEPSGTARNAGKRRFTVLAVAAGCVVAALVMLTLYLAKEQAQKEQAQKAQAAKAQAAREQAAREQAAREQAAREQAAREQAARERAAKEQAAKEQAAREQAAREQAAREQAAREQAANAIRIVSVSPTPNVTLRSGTPVEFAVKVRYRLTAADSAILAFYAERYEINDGKCDNSARHRTEASAGNVLIQRGERDIELRLTWKPVQSGAGYLGLAANFWTNRSGQPVQPTILESAPLACFAVR